MTEAYLYTIVSAKGFSSEKTKMARSDSNNCSCKFCKQKTIGVIIFNDAVSLQSYF